VRNLQQWIEHNILLELAAAPFSKKDAALVPEVGACVDCPKRTGHNVLLFEGLSAQHDCKRRRMAVWTWLKAERHS
jgi:ParB family chromosome partitioning protein